MITNYKYQMKKYHSNESYMHKYSKQLLGLWLSTIFLSVWVEHPFYLDGFLYLRPDIVCLTEDGINTIFEVVNKNDVTREKVIKYRIYQNENDYIFHIFKVNSSYILQQINKPNILNCTLIDIWNYGFKKVNYKLC